MGKNAILVRTLAKARINEFAPDTGDETFSYSSAPHCQTRPTKKELQHTDGSPDVLDRIRPPEFLICRSKTKMRKDKVGNEAVNVRLQ